MEIYLVGGAVRDEIMGLPVKERDWVVVGSTPAEMIEQHFQPVGKEFPVFLHPKTKEEYALARTERKTGKGYKGFVFHADPSVTLTQDLKRRDLTINAIAKDQQGRLIDPFNGQADIKNKRLRHVSEAFAEDPVRILRLARFAARFSDFTVDSTTTALMKKMVAAGEVDALVPERVWQEFSKALTYPAPWRFFNVLKSCGALEKLFPEINPDEKHCQPQNDPTLYFACLMYDLDENAVKHLCQRYRVPLDFSDLAQLVVRFKKTYACLNQEKPSTWLTFLMQSDVLRRPDRFAKMIHVFSMRQTETLKKNQQLTACVNAIKTVDISALQKKGLQGKAMADALWQLRQEAIEAVLHKSL